MCLIKFSSASVLSNLKKLSNQVHSGDVQSHLIPDFNYSSPQAVTAQDYSAWFKQYGNNIPGNLTDCDLEKEMQKVISFVYLIYSCFFFFNI